MKISKPYAEIIRPNTDGCAARDAIYQIIEIAGRTCYQGSAAPDTAAGFVKMIMENGHESVLEHAVMTVRFVVDRGVSHELVRHRLASYSQESTRYCNYSKGKFGNEITVIEPFYLNPEHDEYEVWKTSCQVAENAYMDLLDYGKTPEEARAVLPTSLKTDVVMTANMREWRHFFRLRAAGETGAPHPQMEEVATQLLKKCQEYMPEIFGDISAK